MGRKILFLILCVIFLACFNAFAEDITITTYYPSPYGAYNELGSNKISIGKNSTTQNFDSPANNGSIRFNQVLSSSPLPSGTAGELAYFGADGFKYHNGSAWQSLGGGGSPGDWDYYMAAQSGCPSGHSCKSDESKVFCSLDYRVISGGCSGEHVTGNHPLRYTWNNQTWYGWRCKNEDSHGNTAWVICAK